MCFPADIMLESHRIAELLNMPSQAALLIGGITHARKEWEDLSSILNLRVIVETSLIQNHSARADPLNGQEFPSGTREEFLKNCKAGLYDDVVAIYRSNASNKVIVL